MRRAWIAVGICLSGGLIAWPARAETIELTEGQTLHGTVIKENDKSLFVDLGYTILEIPRDQVERRIEGAAESQEAEQAGREVKTDALYSTRQLTVKSVKTLSEEYGEGVVMVRSPGGLGSGFIIDDSGHVMTNFHVIEGETQISVVIFRKVGDSFQRDKIDKVKIVATNPFFDLALLKLEPEEEMKFTKVYINDRADLIDGDRVFAIGNPLGLERTISEGIVSKRNREHDGLTYIQTTAEINPGNSGGPLFNSRGEVVGVTNMGYMFTDGLGFAIPSQRVIEFLKNREAYAYDSDSPTTGHRYLQPPARRNADKPAFLAAQADVKDGEGGR